MDIKKLYTVEAHEKGAKMQVCDWNGKPLDCYLVLAGIDSKLWRNSYNDSKRKIMEGLETDSEDLAAETLAECTLDFIGFMDGKKKLKFSKKRAVELYLSAPYIKDQVDTFISNRSNFMKG